MKENGLARIVGIGLVGAMSYFGAPQNTCGGEPLLDVLDSIVDSELAPRVRTPGQANAVRDIKSRIANEQKKIEKEEYHQRALEEARAMQPQITIINQEGAEREVRGEARRVEIEQVDEEGTIEPSKAYDSGFFACKRYVDKDENHIAEFHEFFGTKTRFKKGEPIRLIGIFNDVPTKNEVVLKVYSSEGDIVHQESFGKIKDRSVLGTSRYQEQELVSNMAKAGNGKYEANWLVNKKVINRFSFEIYGDERAGGKSGEKSPLEKMTELIKDVEVAKNKVVELGTNKDNDKLIEYLPVMREKLDTAQDYIDALSPEEKNHPQVKGYGLYLRDLRRIIFGGSEEQTEKRESNLYGDSLNNQ